MATAVMNGSMESLGTFQRGTGYRRTFMGMSRSTNYGESREKKFTKNLEFLSFSPKIVLH